MSLHNLPKTLALHYTRILRLWPQDALRGITFHDATRRRLTARILLPALPPQTSVITNETTATGTGTTPKPLDEKDEMEQVNALYSLLENRYSDTYKTSEEMLRPAFNPSYYADLAAEMEEAPKRTWLQRQWLRWGKIVRFS